MALTDTACRMAKARESDYKLTDGGSLYLLVRATGSKLWRQDYSHQGKRKTLSHGAYPVISLADARAKRDEAKRAMAEGRDPGTLATSASGALVDPPACSRTSLATGLNSLGPSGARSTPSGCGTGWSAI